MALIVTILVAYVVKLGRTEVLSKLWIGVGVALVIPLAIGAALTWGPYGMSFEAQEILGGSLSIVAVGFVTWMVFWMGKTARSMKSTLHGRLDSALVGAGWGVVLRGMVKINLGAFFTWTGAFLILVAAGVLAYGIGDLQEAGLIPGGGVHAYDISGAIPSSSWYGTVAAGIVNFNPSP